jgi:hypothetical protein
VPDRLGVHSRRRDLAGDRGYHERGTIAGRAGRRAHAVWQMEQSIEPGIGIRHDREAAFRCRENGAAPQALALSWYLRDSC